MEQVRSSALEHYMQRGKAFMCLDEGGKLTGVCIIVNQRQVQHAIRDLMRSTRGPTIKGISVERAYSLISQPVPEDT